ncbi:MAG: DUF362 domain-containing protein [Candidatus Latescibacteria bacterium]|nr:DUF362 domain-containing protein [Candidatus Latescibacterota bacterium]
MTSRRTFLSRSAAMITALPVFSSAVNASAKDIEAAGAYSDPGQFLVRDGQKAAQKGKKNNIPPVLREEILENPRAVFIIKTTVVSQKDSDGKYPPENEVFARAGYSAAMKIFRKGSEKGGTTYIKPNFVGGFNADPRSVNNGVSTHPWFVGGFCDALIGMGNTNIVVGANGAAKHENFVESGICELMHTRGVCFTEGKYEHWNDYKSSEIEWVDNPEGKVMLQVPFFKLTKEKDTTFINMAKDRIHQLGFTTLTIKNLQGIMPVGYMHICRPWRSQQDAINLQPGKMVINPDYQKLIEQGYVKHANMDYKYWDEGGHSKAYFDAGGWDAFKRGEFEPDYKVFWGEQWGQRMMDIASNIQPCVNMVEGIVGIDGAGKLHLNNFITISRSMVECDSVAAWLMGQDPRELPYLRIANERGLGQNDIDRIAIYEITDKELIKVNDFRMLDRAHMGVHVYSTESAPLRFF